MSENAQNTIQTAAEDASTSFRLDGIPDSLWRRVLEAGRAASQEATSNSSAGIPRRESQIAPHEQVPALPDSRALARAGNRHLVTLPEIQTSQPGENRGLSAIISHVDTNTLSVSEDETIATGIQVAVREADELDRASPHNESQAQIAEGMRRLEDAIRTAEIARATLPPRQPISIESLPGESAESYLNRARQESVLDYLTHQHEFRQRTRTIQALHNAPLSGNNRRSTIVASSDSAAPANTSSASTTSIPSERPPRGRGELERALNDYRTARRSLRNHYTHQPITPIEIIPPATQPMATLAEQQRSRVRARAHSRVNTMDRTDSLVSRIASAAGIANEAWRSDDDGEIGVGSTVTSISTTTGSTSPQRSQGRRNTLPARDTGTSEPYLGPTTSSRPDGSSTAGGMREFYRRIEHRERTASRSGPAGARINSFIANAPIRSSISTQVVRPEPASEQEQRLVEQVSRLDESVSELQARTGKPSLNSSKRRAKNILRYLSVLRKFEDDTDRIMAWAQEHEIDSIADSLTQESVIDLPLHINELPEPQFSSWLAGGMSWDGVQKGGFASPESVATSVAGRIAVGPLFQPGENIEDRVLQLRALRHRERIRREAQEAQEAQEGTPTQEGSSNASVPNQDETRGLLRSFADRMDRMETLADVERHLSDLLEEEERRMHQAGGDEWRVSGVSFQSRPSTAGGVTTTKDESLNQWPVKVTIHDVDWRKMTVTGTMVASQISDPRRRLTAENIASGRLPGNSTDIEEQVTTPTAMETFFDGEIIDFHTYELETVADKEGYKIGGIANDLKYWSRIGPFREAVEKKIDIATNKKAADTYAGMGIIGSLDEQRKEHKRRSNQGLQQEVDIEELDRDEVGIAVYDAMTDCLSSRKWIEKATGEGGWIFMRWKERCFITHSPETGNASSSHADATTTDHTRTRTVVHQPVNPRTSAVETVRAQGAPTYTTTYTDDAHHSRATWGLTIRGFYYVALNRFSGKIEGLYYDSGSQPYQELRCVPTGTHTALETVSNGESNKKENALGNDDIDIKFMANIGIRKDFGVFEFR